MADERRDKGRGNKNFSKVPERFYLLGVNVSTLISWSMMLVQPHGRKGSVMGLYRGMSQAHRTGDLVI